MKRADFIEKIPLQVVPDAKGRYIAIIITTVKNNPAVAALGALYPQSSYRVGVVETDREDLNETIAICSAACPRLVVLSDFPDEKTPIVTPAGDFTCALISSGSYQNTPGNILDFILASPYVTDFSHLAFQQYKYDPEKLNIIRDKYYETLRLGQFRDNTTFAEPLLRGKEYIFFDMNSIRVSDFPENPEQSPNGLYAEEACQLGRYIGMNQDLHVCCISGYKYESLPNSASALLAAEIIWHIIEGISACVYEDPSKSEKDEYFLRKIISMGEEGQDIVFVNSSISGRWWIEIPDFKNNNNQYIACSLSDYQAACNGEVPLRWIFFFQKINPK